ncbi:MAG: HNH endonuclease signature motif containing protein [Clostridium sp.]
MKIRLRSLISSKPWLSETHKRLYGRYNGKPITIIDITMFPIYGCKTKVALCFSQDICNYTKKGRKLIHNNLFGYTHIIQHLLNNQHDIKSVEFNDNKISLIAGQRGRCAVTGEALEIDNMECHHKTPKRLSGTDEYKNLVWLTTQTHKLIHSTTLDTIAKYLNVLNLDKKGLGKVNSLRKLVGNSVI